MNKKGYYESQIVLNNDVKFSIIHNTTKENIEIALRKWFFKTDEMSIDSFIDFLDKKCGFRAFTKEDFLKLKYRL